MREMSRTESLLILFILVTTRSKTTLSHVFPVVYYGKITRNAVYNSR